MPNAQVIGNDMTVGARHGITVYAMQSGEVSGNFVRHWKGARNTSGITVRSGSPIKIADNVSDFIDAAGQTPTGTMNLDEAAGRGITNAVQLAAYLAA